MRVNKFANTVSTWHSLDSMFFFLLIVALKLLRSVVAAGLSFPGAVVESILEGSSLLVEVVVPCGLTIAVLSSGSSEGRSSGEIIKSCKGLSVGILRDQWNGAIKARTIDMVRNRIGCHYCVGHYVPW